MKDRLLGSTVHPMTFLMVSSTDHITGVTGLVSGVSLTVTISKDGGSYAAPSGTVSEVGNGVYALAGNATDRNALGDFWIHATGTGADPSDEKYGIVAYDPYAATNLGLSALPTANPAAAGGLLIAGNNAATTFTGSNASGSTPATPGLTIVGGAASITGGGVAAPAISATGGAGAASTNGAAVGVLFQGGGTNTVASSAHGFSSLGSSIGHGISCVGGGGATGNGFNCLSTSTNGNGFSATGTGTGNGVYGIGGSGASGDGAHFVGGTSGSNSGAGMRLIGSGAGGNGLYATGADASGGNVAGTGILTAGGAASITAGGTAGDGFKSLGGAGAASTNGSGNGLSAAAGGNTSVSAGKDFNATTTPLTLAKTTNITGFNDIAATAIVSGGAITTSGGAVSVVTTLTNLPSIPNNWLTAAGIAAGALNGKGDWLLASSYTTPPTTAQIATAVWTDTTASDFTAASSIGKSLYTAGNVPGAASGLALVGSAMGAVASVTGNVGGNVVGSVGSVTAAVVLPSIPNNWITAAGIASGALVAAVWDGNIVGHTTGGTFGGALNSAGAAGDPWSTTLPGVYAAGTAGYIIGNGLTGNVPQTGDAYARIGATGSGLTSLASHTDVSTLSTQIGSPVQTGSVVDANVAKVNGVTVGGAGTSISPWGPA